MNVVYSVTTVLQIHCYICRW